jgi:hypothetical protein
VTAMADAAQRMRDDGDFSALPPGSRVAGWLGG